MNISPFQFFWQNSKLNLENAKSFFIGIEQDGRKNHTTPNLYYNHSDIVLPDPTYTKNRDLIDIIWSRHTCYDISDSPITTSDLSNLFFGLWWKNGRRNIPSGWAKYPIELYWIIFKSELFDKPTLVYYNTDNHSLVTIKNTWKWEEIKSILWWNLESLNWSPSFIFFVIWNPIRTMEKYSERGGRFILLEAWALMQNLSLIATAKDIGTIILGGYHDDSVCDLIGIDKNQSMICTALIWGYAKHE